MPKRFGSNQTLEKTLVIVISSIQRHAHLPELKGRVKNFGSEEGQRH
jgi:hypothetical protein